ncbi:hypothetical protein ACI65C_007828 [Semiaphis heraclei]
MSCQQLTSVCVFITSCQIASGQFGFSLFGFPQLLTNRRQLQALPPPPRGFHYEPMDYVLKNYPSDSFTIQFRNSNSFKRNNNGKSTGGKNKNNSKKEEDDQGQDDQDGLDGQDDETLDDNTQPPETPPAAQASAAQAPAAQAPAAQAPSDGTPPVDTTAVPIS